MFCLNVILTVQEEQNIEQVRQLLGECGRRSREEPGCLGFEVCHSQSDPRLFILCERWESEQAWIDHKERDTVQQIYIPQVLPLVERVPHICDIIE